MGKEHKTPNKKGSPTKKKLLKISKVKKPLSIGGIAVAIAIAGIIGGFFLIQKEDNSEKKDTLIIGVYMGPQSFDTFLLPWPVSKESNFLFCQVAEGLFEYDYRNVTNPIINNLANTSEWSDDGLNFTCTLRRGVNFHDGTSFNATAVKWNIDRVYYFLNNKPWNVSWWIPDMWHFPDGITPIVNKTIIIDEYTIRFVLNEPYVPFKALLMHISSYILSPTSTPFDRLINIRNETMFGTGPYIMNSFEIINDYGWFGVTSNTTLIANKYYWNGRPEFDEVLFKAFFDNNYLRNKELLSGDLSFTQSKDFPDFSVNQTIVELCINSPDVNVLTRTNAFHNYICMNYERINATMRKAISYAYNYTHDYEMIYSNYGERLRSYLPYNFLYANWTAFDVPDYNITKAREVLKDVNWPGTANLTVNNDISPGNEWEVIANSSTPLATYHTGNGYDNWKLNETAILLAENLQQIGIKLEVLNMSNNEYYDAAEEGNLDFCKARYYPDYDDPNNIISPLFSNLSYATNWQRYNDPYIQDMIKFGLTETNPISRKQVYYDIQKYLIEESCPFILLYNEIQYDYWNSNVGGILSAYKSEFTFHFKDLYIK